MKITVLKKAENKTPQRACPWMIDDFAPEKK